MTYPIGPTNRAFGVASGTIEFAGQPRVFHLHDTKLSRAIVEQVFSGRAYPCLGFVKDVRTILDIGANVGASVLYFAGQYPQARILAFEPFPESYELLVRNVQGLSQISTFNFGLSDQDRQAPLHLGVFDSVTNSLGHSNEASGHRDVMVQLREVAAVLTEQNITEVDILKLDTEGSELPILRSMFSLVSRASVIYLEFHSEADRREIDRMLSPTHVLVLGRIDNPHRGELCYALRERIPREVNDMAIVL